VVACDINPHVVGRVVSELGIEPTDPWAVLETPCDVFSPCALGNIISEDTVDHLACDIIAGSANNQLEDDAMADRLRDRNILYAPDFIANAGGLIQVADEIHGYNPERVRHQIESIATVLAAIFKEADDTGRSTLAVALDHVHRRLDYVHQIRRVRS
jgi:leucine dehydrogenase